MVRDPKLWEQVYFWSDRTLRADRGRTYGRICALIPGPGGKPGWIKVLSDGREFVRRPSSLYRAGSETIRTEPKPKPELEHKSTRRGSNSNRTPHRTD